MTPPSSNSSGAGGAEEERCIVNDQMGAFIVLYILIFIISLPGNLLSLWAFIHSHRAKQSISVYLVNLLVSDLLLTLALPFKILKDLGVAPWGLMVFHCQASAVTVYISLYASILFLAFITTDRYLQPQRFLSCSALKAGVSLHWHTLTVFLCMALFLNASAAVLLSCGLALKRLVGSRDDPQRRVGARRAAASVAALAAAYVVAFVPYHAVRTPYTLAQAKVITDCQTKRRLFLAKEWTLLLAVLHLCFDPLLCCRLLPPLRQTVSEALRCRTNQTVSDTEEQAAEETLQPETAAQQEAVL
ncbi:G-protein coupled receptor 171 isoform X2 [Centroberyx gerrardi]